MPWAGGGDAGGFYCVYVHMGLGLVKGGGAVALVWLVKGGGGGDAG